MHAKHDSKSKVQAEKLTLSTHALLRSAEAEDEDLILVIFLDPRPAYSILLEARGLSVYTSPTVNVKKMDRGPQ
jgi:hypothetical protein